MPKTVQRGLKVSLFLLLFLVCLYVVTDTLELKEDRYHFTYRQEREDSIQVLFLGSSHMFCTVDPFHLYEAYGVPSYSASTSSQTLDLSLLVLEDFLERQQDLRLVVLELYTVSDDTTVFYEQNLRYHRVLDNLPRFSSARWQGIWNLIPDGERSEYVLPIIRHHERWRNLSKADFSPTPYRMKGAFIDGWMLRTMPIETPDILPPEEVAVPPGFANLLTIQEYCAQRGIGLLLLYAPNSPTETEQRHANYIGQQAAVYGLDYINCLHLLEALDIQYDTDFMDVGHLNASGQAKVEDYLYGYMLARYPLTDCRADPDYADWQEDAERYHARWRQVKTEWEEEQHAL